MSAERRCRFQSDLDKRCPAVLFRPYCREAASPGVKYKLDNRVTAIS
jgi:hypothetical protein